MSSPQSARARSGHAVPAIEITSRPARERYLTVEEVAELLGTSVRFPRRLIEERRIAFQRFGRHVRIAESVLAAFIAQSTVEPLPRNNSRRRAA